MPVLAGRFYQDLFGTRVSAMCERGKVLENGEEYIVAQE